MNKVSSLFFTKIYLLLFIFLLQACGESEEKITYAINSEVTQVNFSGAGSDITPLSVPVALSFNGADLLLGYAPDTKPVNWLTFKTEKLTETSVTINFEIEPGVEYPPGEFEATVRVSTGKISTGTLSHHDIIVTLSVWDTTGIQFLAKSGSTENDSQPLTIFFSSPWSIESDVDWLEFSQLSGEGKTEITLSTLLNGNEPVGLNTGNITVTETTTNQQMIIPVELAVDKVRLIAEQQSIVLTRAPSFGQLSAALTIRTSTNNNLTWHATSPKNWLTLDANNDTNKLRVSADVSNLSNGLHEAVITVSSATEGDSVESTQVNVMLYINDIDTTAHTISDIKINTKGVALSPTKPFIYIAQGNSITTHNYLSGEEVNKKTYLIPDFELGYFTMHPDGSTLLCSNIETYLDDEGNEQQRVVHYQFNLSNYLLSKRPIDDVVINGRPIAIKMIDGMAMVITDRMEFANVDLTTKYQDLNNAFAIDVIAKPANTSNISFVNYQTNSIETYQFEYNALAEQLFNYNYLHSYLNTNFEANIYALAYNKNGKSLYSANSNTERSALINGELEDKGVMNNTPGVEAIDVVTDIQDNSYFYRFIPESGFTLQKYSFTQSLISSQLITTEFSQPYISPDYKVVINYNEDDSSLSITPFLIIAPNTAN